MSINITNPPGAFTVNGFCDAFGISHAQFYVLDKQGKTPRSYFLGTRRYISFEAAREWQQQHEQAA